VEEEMGITLTDLQFLHATNDVMTIEQKHYVTIFMGGRPRDETALPRNLEPHKYINNNSNNKDKKDASSETASS
jgi:hypothetical protein